MRPHLHEVKQQSQLQAAHCSVLPLFSMRLPSTRAKSTEWFVMNVSETFAFTEWNLPGLIRAPFRVLSRLESQSSDDAELGILIPSFPRLNAKNPSQATIDTQKPGHHHPVHPAPCLSKTNEKVGILRVVLCTYSKSKTQASILASFRHV